MLSEIFYDFELYQILLVTISILAIGVELGFRSGARARDRGDNPDESLLELIPTSLLGLLALLLGFTFSMAVARFDLRKKALLNEANAIETSFLRTNMLMPEDIEPSRQALIRYLDHRIQFRKMSSKERFEYNAKTKELQADVWALAAKNGATRRDPSSALYINAVNQMIDLGSEREFATDDHVPEVVYYIIFVLMLSCAFSISAIHGRRQRGRLAPLMLVVVLGLVLGLIQDLDRPARGLIQIKPDVLVDLRQHLSK